MIYELNHIVVVVCIDYNDYRLFS